jgi:acyl-CoA thioesterase-1
MKSLPLLLALVCLSLSAAPAVAAPTPEQEALRNKAATQAFDRNMGVAWNAGPDEDVYGLPRILLLCDFVTEGYAAFARHKLTGRANVHFTLPTRTDPPNTQRIHANELHWLTYGRFDVIHFDSGLHILGLPHSAAEIPSQPEIKPEQYEKELRATVALLKKTGAKLIFATMTTAPDDEDVKPFNKIALKVMKENDITIDDLNAAVGPEVAQRLRHQGSDWKRIGTESYTKEDYAILGQVVVKSLNAAITK